MESEREVGFLELLRVNPLFRRYWTANAISMLGEWFNTVAMFVLIDSLTDSALGLGFCDERLERWGPRALAGRLGRRRGRRCRRLL